jgi:hypothetical protein
MMHDGRPHIRRSGAGQQSPHGVHGDSLVRMRSVVQVHLGPALTGTCGAGTAGQQHVQFSSSRREPLETSQHGPPARDASAARREPLPGFRRRARVTAGVPGRKVRG